MKPPSVWPEALLAALLTLASIIVLGVGLAMFAF